jgi:hypothetical protein
LSRRNAGAGSMCSGAWNAVHGTALRGPLLARLLPDQLDVTGVN